MTPVKREPVRHGQALLALKAVGRRSVVDLVKDQILEVIRDAGYQPGIGSRAKTS